MKQETYKIEPHSFVSWKKISWMYCSKCGLVRLKNPFTAWADSKGCNYKDHPSYESQRAKTTPFNLEERLK
jgi:hypothetical protein